MSRTSQALGSFRLQTAHPGTKQACSLGGLDPALAPTVRAMTSPTSSGRVPRLVMLTFGHLRQTPVSVKTSQCCVAVFCVAQQPASMIGSTCGGTLTEVMLGLVYQAILFDCSASQAQTEGITPRGPQASLRKAYKVKQFAHLHN